jgi:hypothetical protein
MTHDDTDTHAAFTARLSQTAHLAERLLTPDQVAAALMTCATCYMLEHNPPADVADLLHGAADEILFKLRGERPRMN